MQYAKPIGSDVQPNDFRSLAAGLGILVTVLMVFSGFSSVLLVGGVSSGDRTTTPSVPASGQATTTTVAPTTSTSITSTSASLASRQALYHSMEQKIASSGVPSKYVYPPNLMGAGAVQRGNVVSPLYQIAPAPMGLGDYGYTNTTGTAVGSVLNTSSVQGDLTLNSLSPFYLMDDGPYSVSVQLNTVAVNVTIQNSSIGQFWIQNVPFYSSRTQQLFMIDNVWNFSSYGAGLPPTTLTGTSPIDPHGSQNQYYYTYVPIGTVPMPFTIQLYNNVTTATPSTAGNPYKSYSTEVTFGFNVVGTKYHGTYDTVFFNSTMTKTPTVAAKNQINGKQCSDYNNNNLTSPFCLLLDAELMIGGPGGGSTAVINEINATMSISTWSGTAWVHAQSAYDYGTDTGETSVGVGEWWTSDGTVNLDGGPSFLFPMWNESKTSTAGDMQVTGTVLPSNAFAFLYPGNSTGFNDAYASWAPLTSTGKATYNLPPGNYSIKAMLSDYKPAVANLTKTLTTFALPLSADTSLGIYTPLFATGNGQLANISAGGLGTITNPYLIENSQSQSIAPEFNQINDYGFPIFPGLLIRDTTSYVSVNNPAPFSMLYVGIWAQVENAYGGPSTNDLPLEVYNASHVTVWGSTSGITGWFAFYASYAGFFPSANVIFWNVTNSLIGNNKLINDGSSPSILLYNPQTIKADNTIWGNTFVANSTSPPLLSIFDMASAMVLYSSGNTIYNNIVNTYPTASTPTYDIYDGATTSYKDTWNTTFESALAVNSVNGYSLSGNIMGYGWQGGNDWIDYSCATPLPYDEGAYPYSTPGMITNGGDYLPINYNYPSPCTPAESTYFPVMFSETSLTAGLGGASDGSWTLTVANYATGFESSTTTNLSSLVLYLIAGTYNYTASTNVSGYFFAAALGSTTISKAATVSVAFEAIPTVSIAPTTGVANNAYLGATNINFGVIVSASAAAAAAVTTEFAVTAASGVSGSGVNPSGAPCPAADWFAEAIPTANSSVLVSTANTTSLLNFCIPSGSSDLPYGGLFASVTMTYMTADPMSGIMTPATFPVVSSGEIFHVYAAITGPAPNQVFLAGNVTISYGVIWAEASARTLIVSGPVGFSTVSIPIAGSTVSGNLTLSLSAPGTYTVELATNDTANVANGYPQAFANVTTTFSVAQAPPNIVIIYNNSTKTSTTYVNTTEAPAGISVGALGAILIVVGIIVGALIGYLFLAPKNRGGKPSSPEPWSGPASGGKTQ